MYKMGTEKDKKGKYYDVQQAEKDFAGNVFNTVRKAKIFPEGGGSAYGRSFVLRRPRLDFEKNQITSEEDIKMRLRAITQDITVYQELKVAGVRHLPRTYHLGGLDEKDPVLVMTDFTEDDTKVVLSNNTEKNGVMISNIENLAPLLQGIKADVVKASEAGYRVPLDAYFFIVPANGGSAEVEFAIADYDRCMREKEDARESLYTKNMKEAAGALAHVLDYHLPDDGKRTIYKNMIREWEKTEQES